VKSLSFAALCATLLLLPLAAHPQTLTTLYIFAGGVDGANPSAGLVYQGSLLYGTTGNGGGFGCDRQGCGTAFSLDPATGTAALLHRFKGGTDGEGPYGGLLPQAGLLYGTTSNGGGTGCGASGCGTVFKIDPTTDVTSILYSFKGKADGTAPFGGLVYQGSALYGTTNQGGGTGCGGNGCGAVFKVDAATGAEIVLRKFGSGTDGGRPFGGLLPQGGFLYGTTYQGGGTGCGGNGCGTVFQIKPTTGVVKVLHKFAGGTDGGNSEAGLIYQGGALYGTTTEGGGTGCGGGYGCGTVFKVDAATGAETVIYSFAGGADGASPIAGLLPLGGFLYGTTMEGGGTGCYQGWGCGTVFMVDPSTGAETVLYSFTGGADGAYPRAGLIYQGSLVYGTTSNGGNVGWPSGYGTVFSLTP